MSLRCLTLVAVCVVFICTEAVSGEDVKKSVGDEVSFRPDKVVPSVSSIIWKHININRVVKVIEWDVDDGVTIPNPRFKDITTLDEKTGQITITNLNIEHSGLYTIDVNSKEQEQRFKLTVTGEEVKNVYGVVGGTVSFGPTSINPSVSSIIWKHKNINDVVVKVIEWDSDDESVYIPNPRFKDITTLDKTTGNITISKLNNDHTGLYTIDINVKEQEQRFKLEILPPVPKPKIQIEKIKINPDAVYLICEYSDTIIWKNSAGDILKGSEHSPKGEVLTVLKTGNPDVFYTCTLKNEVSEETSDPVYERDLFEG